MKWSHDEWSAEKLVDLYESGRIDLSPEYQRNPIWTVKAQRALVDTILQPQPMPNFFVRRLDENRYEMVDGQQRARTIIGFFRGQISSSHRESFSDLTVTKERNRAIRDYPLSISVLTELGPSESIESFYTLVNSSGFRLTVPEIRRAKYYETRFLQLANELAGSPMFSSLGLFGPGTIKRMNDVELVSELLALLKYGVGEKKVNVDRLYEADVDEAEAGELRAAFDHVTGVLCELDSHYPLAKTRYKQRADLYTIFDFIHSHVKLLPSTFARYYEVLLAVAPHIRPSQEHCDPLRDYARNCVSQSHTETARRARSEFFCKLLRNTTCTPNDVQAGVTRFLELPPDLIEIEGAWTVDCAEPRQEGI